MHGTKNIKFEKTLFKWEIYVPLVTKGLNRVTQATVQISLPTATRIYDADANGA
jgi:hypothetical protein